MIHLVTLDFPPDFDGGLASWCEDLARALVAAGEKVVVHAKYTGTSSEYDRILPFPVLRMRGRSWGRWQGVWVVPQVNPMVGATDRVIFATWKLAELLAPILHHRGVPFGVAFHGSELTSLRRTPRGLRRAMNGARALFSVSSFLGDLVAGHGGEPRVLPMPLPIDVPGTPGTGLIVVARLNPLKGVDRAIGIAAALGWPLDVVGDGPAREELEAQAGDSVTFHGRVDRRRVFELLRGKAACMLLPRVDADGLRAEGLGLALLEASARGVPAIGCDVGGVPEVAGLILEDPDDAAGSAAAIRTWLSSGARGLEAHAWVKAEHGPENAAAVVLETLC
ncbi:MAG TPA: glycosyltransferase family 4 protein [Myxococcota bacterium]|nr:glycosyltransferase family 4 protein [Myxococcota bacterium]